MNELGLTRDDDLPAGSSEWCQCMGAERFDYRASGVSVWERQQMSVRGAARIECAPCTKKAYFLVLKKSNRKCHTYISIIHACL
jgi:hypothetical protein